MELFKVEDMIKFKRNNNKLNHYIVDKQVKNAQRMIMIEDQELELQDKKRTMTFALLRKEWDILFEYNGFLESLLRVGE